MTLKEICFSGVYVSVCFNIALYLLVEQQDIWSQLEV